MGDETGRRVLIVDDDEEMTQLLAQAFAKRGFVADSVFNAESALTILGGEYYDAVVTDVVLSHEGGEDGVYLLNQIKRGERCDSGTVVIMITAHTDGQYAIGALNGGADGYLLKPFSPNGLVDLVEEKLAERENGLIADELSRRIFRSQRAISIATEEIQKANSEAQRIVRDGKANGKILEAYLRGA